MFDDAMVVFDGNARYVRRNHLIDDMSTAYDGERDFVMA